MNRRVGLLLSVKVMVSSIFVAAAANAAEISKQAYSAEYELTSKTGKSVHKLAFDGRGHGRSEMISGTRKSVSIADYPNKQISILMPEMKSVMTMPLDDQMMESMGDVGQKVKATAKPLGTKMIDGHLCTGTHYDLGEGGSQEIWTGNDIGGIRVYSKVTTPQIGVSEAHLKSFSKNPPGPENFVVPAEFKKQ